MTTLSRFEIHQPGSVREASQMLAEFGEEAGIYAGGTELLLAMRHKALNYRHLVDLKVVAGLDRIEQRGEVLEIGAACTHRSVERSALVREKLPVLAELESHVANVRVRATGTIGGNLCFAEPHSDPTTLLLVLGAKLIIEGPGGERELPIEEFIGGAYTNNLESGEILTKIVVPVFRTDQRAAYMKFQVRERPTLGVALLLETTDGGKSFTRAKVAVGCVSPSPTLVGAAEKLLAGTETEIKERLEEAADIIADSADLVDDYEGAIDYKRHLIRVFLRRAFLKATGQSAT